MFIAFFIIANVNVIAYDEWVSSNKLDELWCKYWMRDEDSLYKDWECNCARAGSTVENHEWLALSLSLSLSASRANSGFNEWKYLVPGSRTHTHNTHTHTLLHISHNNLSYSMLTKLHSFYHTHTHWIVDEWSTWIIDRDDGERESVWLYN